MNEDDSVIEQARIDVHHSAEQVAAINFKVERLEGQLRKAEYEQKLIQEEFSHRCMALADLRNT